MMGLISCYSELAVQVSQKSSCSNYKNVQNSISPNLTLTPSIQTAITNTYKTTLSTGDHHLITVTWCRNPTTQFLQITTGDEPTILFRLNTNSRFFRKKRGTKTTETKNSKYEVVYDLSAAVYGAGAEPVKGYYVVVMIDSEVGLLIGDSPEESVFKKVKSGELAGEFYLVSRRECFSGDTLYSTKTQFSGAGSWHDIVIRCTGENDVVKGCCLIVCIDKRVVIRVKRLQWNFRGNQTIFVDGLPVDVMWDVHDWFFSGSESGSGSGHGVFLFRTRNGSDSRLWLEDPVKVKDEKKEFSLLVYATKS